MKALSHGSQADQVPYHGLGRMDEGLDYSCREENRLPGGCTEERSCHAHRLGQQRD